MKKIFVLCILMLALVACSGSEEAIAPTETALPSATSKPTVTETPVPTPTETPFPTATLTPTAVVEPLPRHTYLSLLGVGEMFRNYMFLLTTEEIYSIMLEYDLEDSQRAEVFLNRGLIYDWMGELDAAIQDYAAAAELDATNPDTLYSLCWDYSLTNQAEKGLPFCEEAVSLDPDPYYVDGRAIAYALVERFDDAINDFQVVITYLEDQGDTYETTLQERRDWVSALERGENPFTPEVLAGLKNDTIMVEEPPVYVPQDVESSRAAFQAKLEDTGFTFGEIEIEDGDEVLTGTYQDGACKQGLKLVGPQEEIRTVYLSVFGCTDADTQGNITGFMGMFYYNYGEDAFVDSPWLGKIFAWNSTDVYYVIEGMQTDPVSIEIENIVFTAVAKDKQYVVEIFADILP
jgi:tetratricopeptide (TPR) repeat protein